MQKKAPKPADVHVGSRVRLRRQMLGMSQEKLGERLGITFQQIQKYEKGSNRIGASRLLDIANILKVQTTFFFEGLEQTGDLSAADSALMRATHVPGAIDLLRNFEKLGPKGRKALLMSAEGMAEAAAA